MPVKWCLKMSEQLWDPDALVTEPWALTTLPLQKECQACPRVHRSMGLFRVHVHRWLRLQALTCLRSLDLSQVQETNRT